MKKLLLATSTAALIALAACGQEETSSDSDNSAGSGVVTFKSDGSENLPVGDPSAPFVIDTAPSSANSEAKPAVEQINPLGDAANALSRTLEPMGEVASEAATKVDNAVSGAAAVLPETFDENGNSTAQFSDSVLQIVEETAGEMASIRMPSNILSESPWGHSTSKTLIVIFANGRISGFTGCNSFSGEYIANNAGDLEIGPLVSTKKFCGASAMAREGKLLSSIGSATLYSLEGTRLFLESGNGSRLVLRVWKPD